MRVLLVLHWVWTIKLCTVHQQVLRYVRWDFIAISEAMHRPPYAVNHSVFSDILNESDIIFWIEMFENKFQIRIQFQF